MAKVAKGTNKTESKKVSSGEGAGWRGWVAASGKDEATQTLEKRLWDAADQFRANSGLKSQEYSTPVLGLIFLRFADARFAAQRIKLEKAGASARRGSRVDEPDAYIAEGILYLSKEARFDHLLQLPEAENIGAKVKLVILDILTRPAPVLSTEERGEIKKVAKDLLGKIRGILVMDWRQKTAARSKVRLAIEDVLEGLPKAFDKNLYQQKCTALFEHIYETYPQAVLTQ